MNNKKLLRILRDSALLANFISYDNNCEKDMRDYALNLKLDLDKAIKQLERKIRK